MKTTLGLLALTMLASPAWGQNQPAAPQQQQAKPPQQAQPQQQAQQQQAMDLTKMGPATRLPRNEKALQKEVEAFIKQQDEMMKKPDLQASTRHVDFPVYMLTDDAQGNIHAMPHDQSQYVEMMRPFYENMPVPEGKVTHKTTYQFLSDAIVNVADNYSMTLNGKKVNGRSNYTLVKKDGEWKYKTLMEAGWGDMVKAVGGSGEPQQMPSDQPVEDKSNSDMR